ncbi:MAG: PEF-CTERM sorting domain-containing protein [Methanosarcina sp.]
MKKMLLLLVSGLLIVCMAGSAMAGSITIVDPLDLTISPGSTSFKQSDLTVTATNDADYTLELKTTDGLVAYIGDESSDLKVGDATTNLATSTSVLRTTFHSTSASPTHSGKVYIKLANPSDETFKSGEVYVTVYRGTGEVETSKIEVSSASIGVNVPEFPTVALPVAALIGLVFIFGRKKEGL